MNAKIGLEDVRFHGPHGYYEEENQMGNEFSIDIEVESSILGAATEDDLGGTVNYSTIYYLLQAEMKKPTKLLEALAYRMASRVLNQFDSVVNVRLRLKKLNPPLGGKVGAAVVEINLAGGAGSGMGATGSAFGDKSVFDEGRFGNSSGETFGSQSFNQGGFDDPNGDYEEDDDEYYD